MKSKITAFINGLITYDYILFGAVFGLFILFIVLGILLRKKTLLAIILIIISFSILFLGPTLGYIKMHEYLFKNTTQLTSQKKLNYTNAIVVKGSVKNDSKFNFKSCTISASALKVSKNEFKTYIYSFKPLAKMSILEEDIKIGETRDFKLFIEPFTYSKDYNISIGSKCR
nr:DUF2393 domain-containing protein [uncultured Sulfurimonas sp.]